MRTVARPTRSSRSTTPRWRPPALLLALLLALGGFTAAPLPAWAAGAGIIQDYETDESVAATTVSVPGYDSAARVPYGSHGESGLAFTVAPAGTPGSTASSGITLNRDTLALPEADWSGHSYLVFDFWMPDDYSTTGRITIRDTHNVAWGMNYAITARGWTAVAIPLATVTKAGVDIASVKYMGISIPRRNTPVVGYYDSFRLVDGTPDNAAYGARVVQNLVQQVDYAGMLDQVDTDLAAARSLLGDENSATYAAMAAQIDDLAAQVQQVRDGLGSIDSPQQYAELAATVGKLLVAPARLTQVLQLRQAQPNGVFGLDSADSMSLVHPKDLTWQGTGREPEISMARGETEHTQAVVVPYGTPLSQVKVGIRSVTGPDGKPTPGDQLSATVAPVGSLYTTPTGPYRRSIYTGWTPDPIRTDLSSVDVPATDVQPYLVSVVSSADTAPGTYRVQLSVTAEGQPEQRISVTVTVWPVTLQDRPELTTSFQFTPWLLWDLYQITDPDQKWAMTVKYWDFLAEHKIQPDQIYTVLDANPANLPADKKFEPQPAERITYIRDHYGLKQFTAMYLWSGLIDPNKPETWEAQFTTWMDQITTAMTAYEKAGVADKAVIYGFDEASGPVLQAAKIIFQRIKDKYPNLPIMTTLRDNSMGVDSGLAGLVDIWVPQQDLYNQSVAERTRARGDQAWWYPDIATGYPLPNWFNGYPTIDARMLMGPMSHQAGVEGILYYATNRWPLADRGEQLLVNDGILSNWNPATFNGTAGDGSLYYPGADGPMSSLRLENVRDGLEDYNLMQELKRAIAAHPKAPRGLLARGQEALSATSVVTDKTHFTEDPATYRAWRDEVGQVIGLLQKF